MKIAETDRLVVLGLESGFSGLGLTRTRHLRVRGLGLGTCGLGLVKTVWVTFASLVAYLICTFSFVLLTLALYS
jgi:hypothetical protein